jgi:predicted dehydrogenase
MRVAVVGCGAIAVLWGEALATRDGATIVAVVDPDVGAAKAFVERHELASPNYADLDVALAAETPDIVCNITPPEVHTRVNLAALAAGSHVFTEKPLAPTMDEARRVLAAADAAGRRVSVMQNRRYDARIRGLAAYVASGALGPPAITCADYFMNPRFGGFREQMDNPLLLDMAIHHFDQARVISPGARAVRVYAVEVNPQGSVFRGNAVAVCTFECDDGSVFSYRGSWATPGFPTSWEAAWRVSGPTGTALWDGGGEVRGQVADQDAVAVPLPTTSGGRLGHAGCIDEMLDAVADDRRAETDVADNLQSLAMVHAAVESARRREPVEVEY